MTKEDFTIDTDLALFIACNQCDASDSYSAGFFSLDSLEEDGLRKAQHIIDKFKQEHEHDGAAN